MLKGPLLHPELLRALACAGHGNKVLIADANYPFATGRNHEAAVVYLNLCPGKLLSTEVLQALAADVPFEAAEVITPEGSPDPPVYAEFRSILGGKELTKRVRAGFYEHARALECCLVVATGDERPYGTILLTIGVVPPHAQPTSA
jgi:L-fucose mutarotase